MSELTDEEEELPKERMRAFCFFLLRRLRCSEGALKKVLKMPPNLGLFAEMLSMEEEVEEDEEELEPPRGRILSDW